jgi:hemerythrin superfamily protein
LAEQHAGNALRDRPVEIGDAMDALSLLTADHNRVRGLFSRFTTAKDADDTETMTEVVRHVARELDVHTDIEETVFYPWARKLSDEIAEVVDEGIQEHHVAKVLNEELDALDPGSADWVAKCAVLIENVEHHAGEEEKELFPHIRSAAAAEDLHALAGQLEERKAELGAPVIADKARLSTEDLHRLASEQEIPGRSSMNRDELLATVSPQ